MPQIHRNSAVLKKRRPLIYLTATVVMSSVISALLVLILYATTARNEHDELEYSMAGPLGRNADSQVFFPFGQTVDRNSWPHTKNNTGIVAKGFKCPKRYFMCNSTATCIELSRRCDGFVDCAGAEDELDCVCAFRLPLAKFCDKYPDCFDESDENFCNYCPSNSYNCGNGQCIPRKQVCDMKVDCDNAMDENFCFRLSSDVDIASVEGSDHKMSKTGFLLRNRNGVWYPMCAAGNDAGMDSLASYACVSITANPMASSFHQTRKFHESTSATSREYIHHSHGRFVRWNGCLTNEGIFVSCDDFLCGFNPKLLLPRPNQGRIVGGDSSDPGAWPWHAAIYKNGTYACGATLISDQWLLSAAHCFLNYHSNFYEIQLGMLRRRSFTPHQKTYRVSRVVPHKRFNVVTLEFDIVMLKLSEPVTFDFWVRPICLPRPGTVERVGIFCTAIGWGDKGETEDDSDDLQEVHVPLTPSCRRSDRWLCAGYPEGGRDACQGDSGGPLMCPQDDGLSWYIAGVISAGTGCARPGVPGMYTRIAYYLDWIRRVSTSRESRDDYPLTTCPGWKCSAVGGGNCLHISNVCDGHVDCYDAQDEVNCFEGKKRKS